MRISILMALFGWFCAVIGYSVTTWQFWVFYLFAFSIYLEGGRA